MEDAHSIVLSMTNHPQSAFFGVFDGHRGQATSIWTAKTLCMQQAVMIHHERA